MVIAVAIDPHLATGPIGECGAGLPYGGPAFCTGPPSVAPASGPLLAVSDQVRPCQEAAGFRPSFCVVFPDTTSAPDRATLLTQREQSCVSMAAEAPDFCLALPTGATSDGTLRREVALAVLRQRLGPDFRRIGAGKASLWAEAGVSAAVASGILLLIQDDSTVVEDYFGRPFSEPPAVFLFLSRMSFAAGLEHQFGVTAETAAQLSQQLLGVLLVGADAVAINGESVLSSTRAVVYRHELAHVMIHQLAGDQIEPWFDEGLAVVVSTTAVSPLDPERVSALSLIRSDPRALGVFLSHRSFQEVNRDWNGHAYGIAAEGIRVVEGRVGRAGIGRMLELIGAGASLDDASGQVLGESLPDFVARLPQAVADGCTRGLVTSTADANGQLSWRLFGVRPGDDVSVTVTGPARYAFHVTSDNVGSSAGTLGPPMPTGTYVLRATDDSGWTAVLTVAVGVALAVAGKSCG